MKKFKITLQSLCVATVVFGLFAGIAYADGIVLPPPNRIMHETDQKAVIFYDEGIEHLFISISFQGDADDFAWIVPTPAQPDVSKSTDRLFTRLDELTKPDYPERSHNTPWAGKMMLESQDAGVTVLETKKIEYYDISVLEASNKDALYNWLNDHGYQFPQSGKHIIDEYIQKNWIFTAVKIDNQRASSVSERQLRTGHAIPLKLSFKTDQIVYPLKISSITGMEDDAPENQVTYVEGVVGKGVKLDSDRMMSTDAVVDGFDITNGKASFFIKKRDSKSLNSVLKIEKSSIDGTIREGLRISNSTSNVYNFSLYTKNVNQSFSVDLGSDFKENEWQKFEFEWSVDPNDSKRFAPRFYIEDIERALNAKNAHAKYVITNWLKSEKAIFSVGGEFYLKTYQQPISSTPEIDRLPSPAVVQPDNYFVNHTSDILIDEIKLFSNERQVFNADFRNELKIDLAGGEENYLRVFTKKIHGNAMWQKPTGMGILLYVFADKKYEVPGFDIQFAGPVGKKGIENIAKVDGKTPWIEPKKDDYYLTRLYRYMDISEMSEDLYPQKSDDQASFNYVGGEKTRLWLVAALIAASVISVVTMILFVIANEKKKKAKPEKE